jgi:hypothetical protein
LLVFILAYTFLSKVVKSVGKLWQNNCNHTRSCWWSLNKWETVIAFHIASLIVLFMLVLSWCVFFSTFFKYYPGCFLGFNETFFVWTRT